MFAVVVAVVLFIFFSIYVSIKERDVVFGLFMGFGFGLLGLIPGIIFGWLFASGIVANDENIAISTQKIDLISVNQDAGTYVDMQIIDNQWHYHWCYVDENDTMFLRTTEVDYCRLYYSNKENPRVYIQTHSFKSNIDDWLFGAFLVNDPYYVFYIPEGSIAIESQNIRRID